MKVDGMERENAGGQSLMTNAEKFNEIFGFFPECSRACNPYRCDEGCEWREECATKPGMPCEGWWDKEYKGARA